MTEPQSKSQSGLEALIASPLLSPATRQALTGRLSPVAESPTRFTPTPFAPQEFALLERVSCHLVPHDPATLPLARQIAARLSRGDTDGWRYDQSPPDAQAYRQLLAALPGDFQTTDDTARDAALTQVQQALPRIFEDLLAELTEGYYAHPLNQLEIGYVGFADAQGWSGIGLDQLDSHELEALNLSGLHTAGLTGEQP